MSRQLFFALGVAVGWFAFRRAPMRSAWRMDPSQCVSLTVTREQARNMEAATWAPPWN